jgi:hypothetical protein
LQLEVRYRVLHRHTIVASGAGQTIDISSGGIAFAGDRNLRPGALLELSISWPALLNKTCRMKLVTFGRVLRSEDCRIAATIEKYEFRTQARSLAETALAVATPTDSMLRRWNKWPHEDHAQVAQAGS